MSRINQNIQDNLQVSVIGSLIAHMLSTASLVAIITAASITQANAELVIYNDLNQQKPVITLSNNTTVSNVTNSQSINSQAIKAQFINSQAPTDVSIRKLMKVTHIDEQIDTIVNGQQAAIDIINTQANDRVQSADQPGTVQINKRQRELQNQIQGLLGQYANIISNGIGGATDVETMTQAYISVAKSYYTQAEVDAQIKFYDTTIGQSILAKQPQITADFLKQSLPKDMSDTTNKLSELVPQIKQIMKGIL